MASTIKKSRPQAAFFRREASNLLGVLLVAVLLVLLGHGDLLRMWMMKSGGTLAA
jgi:hypothetical protein